MKPPSLERENAALRADNERLQLRLERLQLRLEKLEGDATRERGGGPPREGRAGRA